MYNLAAFILHAVSGGLLLVLTIGNDAWPVYSTIKHYSWVPVNATLNATSCRDVQCKISVVEETVAAIPLEWLVFAFHMMSVVAHFGNYYLWHTEYMRWLERKMNPGRWLEYFWSASIMQVVIMVLTGFTDVWVLSMSAVLIGVTQAFGHVTEQYLYYYYSPAHYQRVEGRHTAHNAEVWQYFWYGVISFLPPWVAIYYSFYWSIGNSDPGPPEWVKAIVWTLVITFASFAGVMVYYIINYFKDDVSYKAEKYYCILSLLAKTLLTWQLYFGVFVRSDRDLVAYNP